MVVFGFILFSVGFLPFCRVNCLLGGSARCEEGSEAGEWWIGNSCPVSRVLQPSPGQLSAWEGLSDTSHTSLQPQGFITVHLGCWFLHTEQQ